MSIINNVLKDLENHPSAFTPLDLSEVSKTKKTTAHYYNTWIAIIILLISGLTIYYFFKPITEELNDTLVLSAPEKIPLIKKQIDPDKSELLAQPEIKPEKELTGLQLNETDTFLELMLQLPLGAQSFLKQSSQNRYVFLILNAGKQIITPDISDNAWLNNISIHEIEAGLEIQFDTMKDVLVETHHKEKGQNYYWNIRLKRSIQQHVFEEISQQNTPPLATETVSAMITEDEPVKSREAIVKLEIKPVTSGVSDADLLLKAHELMQQREWLAAQKILSELLNGSVDKKARIKLIAVYKYQQKAEDMRQLLMQSLELYPYENSFLLEDASLLFSGRQFLVLIERYKNKLDNINIINLVAASFQNINQHDNAIVYYQQSLKLNPEQPRKWISLAISQEQKLQFKRASQSYQIALSSGVLNDRLTAFVQKRLQKLSTNTH